MRRVYDSAWHTQRLKCMLIIHPEFLTPGGRRSQCTPEAQTVFKILRSKPTSEPARCKGTKSERVTAGVRRARIPPPGKPD